MAKENASVHGMDDEKKERTVKGKSFGGPFFFRNDGMTLFHAGGAEFFATT